MYSVDYVFSRFVDVHRLFLDADDACLMLMPPNADVALALS
jgi:hypothetical protein